MFKQNIHMYILNLIILSGCACVISLLKWKDTSINLPPYALHVILTVSFSLYGPITDGRSVFVSSRIITDSGGTVKRNKREERTFKWHNSYNNPRA